MADVAFVVKTPLGFIVRCTRAYWNFILTEKPPVLAGQEEAVRTALADPDQVRRSKQDENVYLSYRGVRPRWICAVVRREDGTGFLITAYPTDTIKIGETVWTRSK
ncbi:MAG: hypothetical protein C4293_06285 [Nitrospiraceae bacterium]